MFVNLWGYWPFYHCVIKFSHSVQFYLFSLLTTYFQSFTFQFQRLSVFLTVFIITWWSCCIIIFFKNRMNIFKFFVGNVWFLHLVCSRMLAAVLRINCWIGWCWSWWLCCLLGACSSVICWQGRNHGIDIGGVQMWALPQIFFLSAFPTIHNFHILIKICSSRT